MFYLRIGDTIPSMGSSVEHIGTVGDIEFFATESVGILKYLGF